MKFMMCLRPEWCCFRPGTDECVSEMSQYSQLRAKQSRRGDRWG